MMRARSLSTVLLLFLSIPFSARAQTPWSGIIAPSRAVNWSNAGVERRNAEPQHHLRDHSSLRQQRIA